MTFSKLGTDTDTGQIVELSQASRRQGLYIIGANGTGKTGLIEHLILQDIDQGLGVGLLDPHGDLVNAILAKMTKREADVILLDIQDEDHPFGLNMFECPNPQSNTEVQIIVDLVMHIFEKLYDVNRAGTPLLLDYLRNCTYTLVANPGYTMADIPLLFTDQHCRQKLLANISEPYVQLFWHQYEQLPLKEQRDEAASTMRRVREFLQPLSRNIVGQAKTTVNMQQIMDERKILLVKLSAQLDQVTSLIGSVIIAMILNAAYSRASLPVNKRKQFNLYADEFQRFATEDFATLLTEARKFGIATTIAHQARYQPGMTDGIRAVSLQAANHVVFRVTSPDADELAGGFDVSPQAAWEEEIAKEWVEVLKQEWYERVEEEVIDGEEEIKTPVKNVVHHLLNPSSGSHPHPVIYNFVTRKMRGSENFIYPLNPLLYEAMVYQRFDNPLTKEIIPTLKGMVGTDWPLFFEFDLLGRKSYGLNEYGNPRNLNSLYEKCDPKNYTPWDLNTILQGINVLWTQPHNSPICQQWITYLDTVKTTFWFEYYKEQTYSKNKNYTQAQVYQMSMQQARANIDENRTAFLNFLQEFTVFLRALGTPEGRIEEGSGVMRPRKRKQINYHTHPAQTLTHPRKVIMHPQRTYQDVQNDIANQLSGFPNFTAQVKLSEIVSHNPGKKCRHCGYQSISGDKFCKKCGKKLPAPNEYTFTTLKPLGGLGKAALQQRLTTIQANNIQQRYVRDRTKVEAEIIKRQTSCSSTPPAQPQQPQQQPQQPSPQQSPRHARQVPVQGKCPSCGAGNASNAKFCNQCGAKLR